MDLNNDIKTFSVLFGIPFLTFPNILPLFWAPSLCFTDYLGLIPRSFPRIYQLILYVITFLHVILGLFFETVSPMTSLLSALNSTCHFTAQLLIVLLWFSTLCLCLHYLKWLHIIHRLHCLAVASLCRAVYECLELHTDKPTCASSETVTLLQSRRLLKTDHVFGRPLPVWRECPLTTVKQTTRPALHYSWYRSFKCFPYTNMLFFFLF